MPLWNHLKGTNSFYSTDNNASLFNQILFGKTFSSCDINDVSHFNNLSTTTYDFFFSIPLF